MRQLRDVFAPYLHGGQRKSARRQRAVDVVAVAHLIYGTYSLRGSATQQRMVNKTEFPTNHETFRKDNLEQLERVLAP